jgi:hypothetical protein
MQGTTLPVKGESMSVNQRLDVLFNEWKTRYPDKLFVRDGVINDDEWQRAERRIVFLLKENNCGPMSWSSKQPKAFQEDFRLLCNLHPWQEIGQWAYGLLNLRSVPTFEEAKINYASACRVWP